MKRFRSYTDQELARALAVISMSEDEFFLRFLDADAPDTEIPATAPDPDLQEEY